MSDRENERACAPPLDDQPMAGFEGIVGASPPMERLFALLRRIAPTDGTVLISGESGTGKEMVARALHRQSGRADRAFLACDCSTLAPTLLESELFGHTKGAFTGASADKAGLFEAADRGTLFLDEIGNLCPELQAKLLRTLESRQIRRVGETAEQSVDIRLIAATNRDLEALVQSGRFRGDLFYRLNVLPVRLPPLRERPGDVLRLLAYFLARFRPSHPRSSVQGFDPAALSKLEHYPWPGNVRELRNIVERLVILGEAESLEPRHLPEEVLRAASRARIDGDLPDDWESFKRLKQQVREASVEDLERRFVRRAIERAGGNISLAARETGLGRTHLHALLRKHGQSELLKAEDDEPV